MIYRFVLKDSASGEQKFVSVAAESPDEALAIVEMQELKRTAYQLEAEEVARLESELKAGTLSGSNKARLFTHMQTAPYRVSKGAKD